MKTKKTKVCFYVETSAHQILAVFPKERFSIDPSIKLIRCYAHIGQHSNASPAYFRNLPLASVEQYTPLKMELESIGYDLEILNPKPMTTIEKLTAFVNQKPGLEPGNYSTSQDYQKEMREITKDRNDYYELLSLFLMRYEKPNDALTKYLKESNGRLVLKNGELEYTAGLYWCVEYRPAANRVIADLIWADYRDERSQSSSPVYADGHAIRKALRNRLSNRLMKNYFN